MPPFMGSQVPPLVMLVMGRDHKNYYEAYNDASDLDHDGNLDVGYKHSYDYYGYFDPYKCYVYNSSISTFVPSRATSNKYCGGTGEWSGNFLNWLSMSRMDILRKVLYGGHRSTDTTSTTVLEGVYIPQDAHSWGKEYFGDDTRLLTPYDEPSNTSCNMPDEPAPWDQTGKILFVIYDDAAENVYGSSHSDMLSSFDPLSYSNRSYLTEMDTTNNFSNTDRIDTGNYILVTEFYVDSTTEGDWSFSIDSDDGSEVEVDGVVVTSYYGPHWFCSCNQCSCTQCQTCQDSNMGSIHLGTGWHRMIVRLRENYGDDGVLVWYKNPVQTSWTIVGASTLQLRAPTIDSDCRVMTSDFIETGTPGYGGSNVAIGHRHLFCMTSLSEGAPHRIRVILDSTNRIWEWASKESPVCDNSLGTPDDELEVRVKVCDPNVGLEKNCKQYPSGDFKPVGVLQKYAENDPPIRFGLITGSYTKNLSGGVLRKNIGSLTDEYDTSTGIFYSSLSEGIINTIDRLKITGYSYGQYYYTDNCGWITTHSLEEGECSMWGNPIGEMMYEGIRYFAGLESPTPVFNYSGSTDDGLNLPKPSWEDPYDTSPECSRPSLLIISDINTSYDDDSLPGSYFGSFTGDLPNLNVADITRAIGIEESISNNQYYIGHSGSNYDFVCSAKTVDDLGQIEGLCPEEPTKRGTYYPAALAYYGKNKFESETSRPSISTYTVALSSPIPDIKISLESGNVTLVPIGKSVSGCINQYSACLQNCTYSTDSDGLKLLTCNQDAYCPSNQIVDFYVSKINNDSGEFRVNFEDVEQGADHDMDAIVTYRYEVIDNNHVKISLSSDYASGCIDQILGFVVSGTTEDGVYLPVRDLDSGSCDSDTPNSVCNMPLRWEKTFTVNNGASPASLLKNPLWFAAKWGGFSDINHNKKPDINLEWDKDGDETPDNYFFADKGEVIEQALEKIFKDVLSNAGAAASVATVTQEVLGEDLVVRGAFTFYDDDPDVYTWRGHLEIYKPFFHCSDFSNQISCEARGCTWDANTCSGSPDINYDFELCSADSCPSQYCINKGDRCVAKFCSDMTGNKHCIDAGQVLNERTTPRNIFTFVEDSQTPFEIASGTDAGFWNDYLQINHDFNNDGQAGDEGDVEQLIQFIRGEINGNGTSLRERQDGWKLGDIIYSSPVVVGPPEENSVAPQIAREDCENLQRCFEFSDPNSCNSHEADLGCFWSYYKNMCTSPDCEDMGQQACINQPACQWDSQSNKCNDKSRNQILDALSDTTDECFYSFRIHHINRERVIYVGANDGMLHAFSVDTGEELWAYIPSNLLSELQCLADPEYGKPNGCRHRYMVDLSPRIWNVKFKSDNKWHTVLVGGERGGGDVYFAIDVTEPRDPRVLWEYSVFRNMALHANGNVTTPFTKSRYIALYGDNATLKTLPASWTEPAMAYMKIGNSVTFKASPLVPPLSDSSLSSSTFHDWSASDLSDWFLIVGGSIRVFNYSDLPTFLSSDEKQAIFKPYLLAIDIEKGVNIFQNLWPDIVNELGMFPENTNGINTIPYALTTPLLLDTWDAKGCNYINDANVSTERKYDICQKAKYCSWVDGQCSGMLLGPDGYTDHIILGDINGNFYNIKFNFSDNFNKFIHIELRKTKKICPNLSDPQCKNLIESNIFRSDRQPITIPPVAAFDDDYNLRIFTGTGKLDNSYGGPDDSNDQATMSFYNIKEDSIDLDGNASVTSSYATGFDVSAKEYCQDSVFNDTCNWIENSTPDCCESNCSDSCWSCVFDFNQPGEKVLYSPLVASGLVFVTSFVPDDDPCSAGGRGYLYILKYDCKDLFTDCSNNDDLASCSIQKSCFWDASSSSCLGCEYFDSNTTCSQHTGCKWVEIDANHEFCTTTNDILSDSGLKPAFNKSAAQLEMAEYTKIGTKGYAVSLGPGVPSQPIYSQGKGGESTLFIQTSDAKIFRIKIQSKDKHFLGWSWDSYKSVKESSW